MNRRGEQHQELLVMEPDLLAKAEVEFGFVGRVKHRTLAQSGELSNVGGAALLDEAGGIGTYVTASTRRATSTKK